jgi:hypothetical protein
VTYGRKKFYNLCPCPQGTSHILCGLSIIF